MIERVRQALRRWSRLVALALRAVAGRRFWIMPLLPALVPVLFAIFAALGANPVSESQVLRVPFGIWVSVLGIVLGIRVIGAEVDARTLEIAYTVPGGAHRVWLARLLAAALLLFFAMVIGSAVVYLFLTDISLGMMYTIYQGAIFHLVLATWLGALLRGTITAGMVSAPVLFLVMVLGSFAPGWARFSPLFNHVEVAGRLADPTIMLAYLVQNRIATALLVAGVALLAFGRAERREKMLSG